MLSIEFSYYYNCTIVTIVPLLFSQRGVTFLELVLLFYVMSNTFNTILYYNYNIITYVIYYTILYYTITITITITITTITITITILYYTIK